MVFTKIDKIGKRALESNIENYKKEMLKEWEEIPQCFYTSTLKREGNKDILTFIEKTNPLFAL
jgi:GTP-binding protein